MRRYLYIACFSSFLSIFFYYVPKLFKLLWFKTKVNNAYKSKSNPAIRTNESEAVRRVQKKPTNWAKYHFIATVQGMWNFRSVCMCVSFPFATISFFFWEIKCHSYSLAEKNVVPLPCNLNRFKYLFFLVKFNVVHSLAKKSSF